MNSQKEKQQIFIEATVAQNEDIIITSGKRESDNEEFVVIKKKDETTFIIQFLEGSNEVSVVADEFLFMINSNVIYANLNESSIFGRNIDKNVLLHIIDFKNNTFVVNCLSAPVFSDEFGLTDKYPKFDINISDCMYNMKIYLSKERFLSIPYFQSHYSLKETLSYISELTTFLSDIRPEFIDLLCTHNAMNITVMTNGVNTGIFNVKYQMTENNIVIDSFKKVTTAPGVPNQQHTNS